MKLLIKVVKNIDCLNFAIGSIYSALGIWSVWRRGGRDCCEDPMMKEIWENKITVVDINVKPEFQGTKL